MPGEVTPPGGEGLGRILQEATALAANGRYAEAIAVLEPHLAPESDRKILYGLGYCHLQLGHVNQAKPLLRRAYRLGHRRAGLLLEQMKDSAPVPPPSRSDMRAVPLVEPLLELGYFESRSRAEVRQQWQRLAQNTPESLSSAGDYAGAVEASVLGSASANYRDVNPHEECAEGDVLFDQSCELLRLREFSAAALLLERAAQVYRRAESSTGWSLADTLWNLGYALSCTGRLREADGYLRAANQILCRQSRILSAVRCGITLLAERACRGLWDILECRAEDLLTLCSRAGFLDELVRATLLAAVHAQEQGNLGQVDALFQRVSGLSAQVGPEFHEQTTRFMASLNPESVFRALVGRLAREISVDSQDAVELLLRWSPADCPEDDLVVALRAFRYGRLLGFQTPRYRRARDLAYLEMALAMGACNDHSLCAKAGNLISRKPGSRRALLEMRLEHASAGPRRDVAELLLNELAGGTAR